MTAPRAAGVRLPWTEVPAQIRTWATQTIGAPLVAAQDQIGGMSPGCATRLAFADGTRVFVKAVGASLNPDTPTLFRREDMALTLIGTDPLWAGLLATYDDGDWVALMLEDVAGSHPDLANDVVMARLLEATDRLVATLQERVSADVARRHVGGWSTDPGLTDTSVLMRRWADSFDHLPETPDAPVPAWVRAEAGYWQERTRALATAPMDHLVHWDIRNDNLLQRPTGDIVFLDCGAAGVGPAWLDPLLARLEQVHLPWFDDSLASSSALATAGDDAVTTWLVGFGAMLAWRSVSAVDVNLPTLNAFRRAESARFLAAAERRLGI